MKDRKKPMKQAKTQSNQASKAPKSYPFYFTFGSDPRFPFQNGYIIIYARTHEAARARFRSFYPDRPVPPRQTSCLNFAFSYSKEQWEGSINADTYGKPFRIIREGEKP